NGKHDGARNVFDEEHAEDEDAEGSHTEDHHVVHAQTWNKYIRDDASYRVKHVEYDQLYGMMSIMNDRSDYDTHGVKSETGSKSIDDCLKLEEEERKVKTSEDKEDPKSLQNLECTAFLSGAWGKPSPHKQQSNHEEAKIEPRAGPHTVMKTDAAVKQVVKHDGVNSSTDTRALQSD
ncbi:hypothetical protein C0991_000323, partial [Blastosporella zonata]